MRVWIGVCVLLLASLPIGAESPPESSAEVRHRIDRLITTTWTLAMRGTLPSDVPDLTTQVNAILAMPEEVVIEALRDALRLVEERGHPAASLVKSLAMLTADARILGEGGWWMGAVFAEFHGAVVIRSVELPRMQPNAKAHWVVVLEGARLRKPLTPDPHAILDDLLARKPAVFEVMGRPHPGSRTVTSLAAPVGLAARSDPVLADRLLDGLAKLLRRDETDSLEAVCVAAAGFLNSVRARQILLASLAQSVSAEWGSQAAIRGCHLLGALRQAGAAAEALDVLRRHGAKLEPEDLRHRGTLLGGDATVLPWLERARRERTVESLEGLAQVLNEGHAPSISLSTRLSAADLARDLGPESGTPSGRAALAVLQTALWAGLYGKYGYCECPNTPSDIAGGHPKGARSPECFRGGWPDPLAQLERLEEDLAADRMVVDVKLIPRSSLFEKRITHCARDGDWEQGVTLSARREGSVLKVRVTNGWASRVALNPLIFRYGTAVRWPLAGLPAGRDEIRLRIGRILPHHRCRVPASVLLTLPAGASFEARYPLPADLHPASRILVTLVDEFQIEGVLDLPVIRLIDEVRAK